MLAEPAMGGRVGRGRVGANRLFSLCQPYREHGQADKMRAEARGVFTSKGNSCNGFCC